MEIDPSDRFECKVIEIIDNLKWKGVMVQESVTNGIVYFARVAPENNLELGDTLYLKVQELAHELDEMGAEIQLMDENDNKIDWTYISRGVQPQQNMNTY
ncbi:hypothetical protein J2755_001100 [Methanohalophilus levihalophilus]|uniref:hypothetical protein n=1 Tax=Methanohalophilus levihalophilus TaxID=1431282 RepID=UPI001FD9D2DA|nr:hypothetical protein [Methanohalophilus levihalophilus]MBP2030166.1 hypothetical protein [Methanohalophilus levihalophilus]